MNRITKILPDALIFAEKILNACQTMKEMLGEFENFKKSAGLHELVIKLNDIEEECDRLYLKAKHEVLSLIHICSDGMLFSINCIKSSF